MQFVESELINKSNNNISNLMLNIFIRYHLRFLIFAAIRLDGFILWQEILLFGSVRKSYGMLIIFSRYPLILLNEIQKRIVQKGKYFINYFFKN